MLPAPATVVIICAGLLWQMYAKCCLGRHFGILPAHRGIVRHGAYRLVRHPIYLGYFISHAGFLLGHFSAFNLAVLAAFYLLKLCRIHCEERLLRQDSRYRDYCTQVKYRLIPFLI